MRRILSSLLNVALMSLLLWVIVVTIIVIKEFPHSSGVGSFNPLDFLDRFKGEIFSFEKLSSDEFRNIFLVFGGLVGYWGYQISRDKLELDEEKEEREKIEFEASQDKHKDEEMLRYIEMCSKKDDELIRYIGFSGLFSLVHYTRKEKHFNQAIEVSRLYLSKDRKNDTVIESKIIDELANLMQSTADDATTHSISEKISRLSRMLETNRESRETSTSKFYSLIKIIEGKLIDLQISFCSLALTRRRNRIYRKYDKFYIGSWSNFNLSGIKLSVPASFYLEYGDLNLSNAKFYNSLEIHKISDVTRRWDRSEVNLDGVSVLGEFTYVNTVNSSIFIDNFTGMRVSGEAYIKTPKDTIRFEGCKLDRVVALPGKNYKVRNGSEVKFYLDNSKLEIDGWLHRHCDSDSDSKVSNI